MAGFTSYDDLINEMTVNGKRLDWSFYKTGPAAQAAGQWLSLWYAAGSPGVGADPAATPGTAYTSTGDVAGSIGWANVDPDTKHLLIFGGASTVVSSLMIYDRLVGVSGIALSSTGAKTVNSTALPRYSGTAAALVEVWLEITTATTTTAPVVNLSSYTNQTGTTGRAGPNVTFPAAATVVRWACKMPLQAGDQGVRSVETLTVTTAAAAGVCAVFLMLYQVETSYGVVH